MEKFIRNVWKEKVLNEAADIFKQGSQRYEMMEKGTRHVLKAEVLKNIGREAADIVSLQDSHYKST